MRKLSPPKSQEANLAILKVHPFGKSGVKIAPILEEPPRVVRTGSWQFAEIYLMALHLNINNAPSEGKIRLRTEMTETAQTRVSRERIDFFDATPWY